METSNCPDYVMAFSTGEQAIIFFSVFFIAGMIAGWKIAKSFAIDLSRSQTPLNNMRENLPAFALHK